MIHIYHGDGKGKTTAAVGLAVRATSAGYRVMFCQFMKGGETSELKLLKEAGKYKISIHRCEREYPFYGAMSDEDKKEITAEHNRILDDIMSEIKQARSYDNSIGNDADTKHDICGQKVLAVLDEITYPCNWHLVETDKLKELLNLSKCNDSNIEIVLTGRDPSKDLLELADYITEMKCIRHPYDQGFDARIGIEY